MSVNLWIQEDTEVIAEYTYPETGNTIRSLEYNIVGVSPTPVEGAHVVKLNDYEKIVYTVHIIYSTRTETGQVHGKGFFLDVFTDSNIAEEAAKQLAEAINAKEPNVIYFTDLSKMYGTQKSIKEVVIDFDRLAGVRMTTFERNWDDTYERIG